MAKLIVKGGDIVWAGTPGRGGWIMCVLQWLEGLRRLGHEILYYDRDKERPNRVERTKLFAKIMEQWWDPRLSAQISASGEAAYGLNAKEVEEFGRNAAAIISLGCPQYPELEPWLANIHPRVLVDLDPAFTHLSASRSTPADIFGCHDVYFTVGANVGTHRCSVPTCGIEWQPIWNPVVLDWWDPGRPATRNRFTTVAGSWWWWGDKSIEFEGQLWGSTKAEQFRKFVTLPQLLGEPLEIALELAPDNPEVEYLAKQGWRVESPKLVTSDAAAYTDYVHSSLGEFSCAKGLYVGTRCGWFSDRSECYLAAGRPAVLQATGFTDVLPTGQGLFSVSTVEEAAEAIRAIRGEYVRHSAAARKLAVEYFDSQRLLSYLLRHIGI
jgi:hypothetical protein